MRVGYYLSDQNPHRDRTRGITVYTAALLEQLQARHDLTIHTVRSRSSFAAPQWSQTERALPFRTDHFAGRLLGDQLHPLLAPAKVDLWHYPKGFLPLALRSRQPVVGTVHDVILQYNADHYPGARSRAAYEYWLLMLRRSIARLDLILTISEFSKRQIAEFAERHRVRCPPIIVAYPATDWQVGKRSAKDDFMLHLASPEPHKRTATLLEYWGTLEAKGTSDLRLELVGQLSKPDLEQARKLKSVKITRTLSRQELRDRLSRARALILPSEIEGFGLPALESYAVGTPVLYARGTSVEEILGPGTPGGFNLEDPEAFLLEVTRIQELEENAIAEKACALQERFSWKDCADRTLSAYRGLT